MSNLYMPGNPRYQPKDLIPYCGYDHFARYLVRVELAAMDVLGEAGVIPSSDYDLLTPEVRESVLAITMSEVDKIERTITKHDIRALVMAIQERLPPPLRRWVHVPLTSYDPFDSARALMFVEAHQHVVMPKARELIRLLAKKVRATASIPQVGRTHGQHALPITAGFWLATILARILENVQALDAASHRLCGKISGPVGAYNAQVALDIFEVEGRKFEDRVLGKLGLKPGPISTQLVMPERTARYLVEAGFVSAALGQLGCDGRQLMRSEIGEISEPFGITQVGSSTMAHKRNPITFENLQGMWEGVKAELWKVFSTLVSEHQRDLTGSSVMRDFPTIIVKLVYQLDNLLRESDGRAFVERIMPDEAACARNLAMQGDLLLAEPMYLALQVAGYPHDAHHLVNHGVVEYAKKHGTSLMFALLHYVNKDPVLADAWARVPQETQTLLRDPKQYTGMAINRALVIALLAEDYLESEIKS